MLAHEHAHAHEWHHVALAPFHALHRALPCRATAHTVARLELLIEMCADDHAAHRHGTAPPGALAASDSDVEVRIQRLLRSQPAPGILLRVAVVTVVLVLLAGPVSLFVLPA